MDLSRQSRIDSGNTAQFEGSILLGENFTLQGDGYLTNVYTGSVNDHVLSISNAGLIQKINLEDKVNSFIKAGTGIGIGYSGGLITITNTGVTTFNGRNGAVVPTTGDYNTSQVIEGSNKYYTDSRVSDFINSISNIANGILRLNNNIKIDDIYLPKLAITDVFVVADIPEMLALEAEVGDVAKVLSGGTTYILQHEPATELTNWIELSSGSGSSDTLQDVMSRSNLTQYDLVFNKASGSSLIRNNNTNTNLHLLSATNPYHSSSLILNGSGVTSLRYSSIVNIGSTGSTISELKTGTTAFVVQTNSSSGLNKSLVFGVDGKLLLEDNTTGTINYANYKLEVKDLVNAVNAKFWGRVKGSDGVDSDDFTTLGQNDLRFAFKMHSHVWTDITDRPTALSQFTNDLGNYGGWITKTQADTYYYPLSTNPASYVDSTYLNNNYYNKSQSDAKYIFANDSLYQNVYAWLGNSIANIKYNGDGLLTNNSISILASGSNWEYTASIHKFKNASQDLISFGPLTIDVKKPLNVEDNIYLRTTTGDTGAIIFQDGSNNEIGKFYKDATLNKIYIKFNDDIAEEYEILHSGKLKNQFGVAGVLDGVNKTFLTEVPFKISTTELFINGIKQFLGLDYTELDNQTIFIDYAPEHDTQIIINYIVE